MCHDGGGRGRGRTKHLLNNPTHKGFSVDPGHSRRHQSVPEWELSALPVRVVPHAVASQPMYSQVGNSLSNVITLLRTV